VLAILSLIGGLFTSISAGASIIVAMLTQTQFITVVTKELFLAKRFQARETTLPVSEEQKAVEASAAEKKISTENFEKYCQLKTKI
jgi:hypothetical protein